MINWFHLGTSDTRNSAELPEQRFSRSLDIPVPPLCGPAECAEQLHPPEAAGRGQAGHQEQIRWHEMPTFRELDRTQHLHRLV